MKMTYNSFDEAKYNYEVSALINQIMISTRIIRLYKECQEPASPNLKHELQTYSDLLNVLNKTVRIPGKRIFFDWNKNELVTKELRS